MWAPRQKTIPEKINDRIEKLLASSDNYSHNNQTANYRLGIIKEDGKCEIIINNQLAARRVRGDWTFQADYSASELLETLNQVPIKNHNRFWEQKPISLSSCAFRGMSGL